MEIGGGWIDLRFGITIPSAGSSLSRKLQCLHAKASSIEKQFHRIATRVADDGDELTFAAFPVPVGKEVEHRVGRPLALVEVVIVLGEAEGIQHTPDGK